MRRFAAAVVAATLLGGQDRPAAPQDHPELAWWRDSMRTRDQRLAWWREARFGMFIHWGAYSLPAGVWEGTPVSGYAEHIQRIRKIPISVYRKEVVAKFNPVRFNADEWVTAAKRAGMGYLIITAKHHDGFAMYDSAVSDYTIVKMTPFKRDPMRELKDASARHGLRFGFYYSHAFDWGEANAAGNDWEYENPGGDRQLHGANWWEKAPELVPRIRRYVDEKAIPQVRELIRNYDPDIMWFDTPHKLPVEENLRILRAAREAKPTLVINGRVVQAVHGGPSARFGDYMSTADRPAELLAHEGDWEAIPTTNESYAHHTADNSHKPPQHFVKLLADAAARGGNLLLNIGPMGDGAIDPKDLTILDGIGRWMRSNAESILGTERTPLPIQSWGHSTRKGNRLYLHVLNWPTNGKLYVAGLRSGISRSRLLVTDAPLTSRRLNRDDQEIAVPAEPPDPWNSVIAVDVDQSIEVNPVRLISNDVPTTLHVFHGRLVGEGIRYGDGKRLRDATMAWTGMLSGVDWDVRVAQSGRFRVTVNYATPSEDSDGRFQIRFGDRGVEAAVHPTGRATTFKTFEVGEIALDAGEFPVRIRPTRLPGGELMLLRTIELTPIASIGPVAFSQLSQEVRARLGDHGRSAEAFDAFVAQTNRRTADREQAGEREHLIYFILQTRLLTSEPPIEPALSAKSFVLSGAKAIPADADRRIAAFLSAGNPAADGRLVHFLSLVPAGDRAAARRVVERAYAEAMRFLYEKEFTTAKENVAALYQERGHSTDTALEASYPVDQALRVIAKLAPSARLRDVLVVGPGLDLAPRTDFVEEVPPQSVQPLAVADTLIASGLAEPNQLQIHSIDISEPVVRYLAAVRDGRISRLFVFPGLAEHSERRLADDYRAYVHGFGAHIGTTVNSTASTSSGRAVREIVLDGTIVRRITADRMNVITERYTTRTFDAIVVTNVFPYFSDAELTLALSNLFHVLRRGGYLVHNESRASLPVLAAAAGFEPLHVRGVALATGRSGAVSDAIWIQRRP